MNKKENEMTEIWKDVRDYQGLYQVSNLGRVKRLFKNGKEKIKKGTITNGYVQVTLHKRGCKRIFPFVHRLVFEAFYRRLLPNEDCHHLNEVRNCNICTNLVAIDHSLHETKHKKGKTGRVLSQQTKQKISLAKRGKTAWNKGKKLSQQTKQRMIDAWKKRKAKCSE